MSTHRKPPSRRSQILTAVLIAVVVFAVIKGFGGSPKKTPTAQTGSASPAVTASASPTPGVSPGPSVTSTPKATTTPSTKPASKPATKPKPKATKSVKKTPAPKPSATSTGLGTNDASLKTLQARAAARPVEVRIPALHVDAPITPVGVDDKGALEVPENVTQAAWYRSGAAPGGSGTAILAAHVDFGGKTGLFNGLHTLKAGDVIYVTDFSRHVHKFTVVTGKLAPKSDPSTVESLASASAQPGRPYLALITCGGALDTQKHSYYDNYVLLAQG